ncbi:uncharacterized protein K444DRAFT_411127 [Hyaloscypha bicolor E]|uniref:Uncharacterized protein n=1 Tax=Hyaloscypha bicolor E TaxID=1095630 RepID=A0A2J6T8P7_9HELO|nr:uncharacterized protein K444DRAFT_411127 [Hyaloscypha bicolor E]PMD59395.1 hypothetical protein K444DRAFT_411127 [Hyaloscypha bicolor E]
MPLLEQYLLRYKHFLSFKQTNKQTGFDSHYLLLPFKMQLSTLFLMFATTLLPLISGGARLAGGPADQVTAANTSCRELTGTWFVSFPFPFPFPFHSPYLFPPPFSPSPSLLSPSHPLCSGFSSSGSLRSQVRHGSQSRDPRAPRLGDLLVEALRARDPGQCGLARYEMYPWGWCGFGVRRL